MTSMLNMIAGEDAVAKSADGISPESMTHHALFVDSEGNLVASCDCDLMTAAALGCALSMIPPGGAGAMVEDGQLSTVAAANLYEVMNILSSLLMSDHTPHLKLERVEVGEFVSIDSDDVTEGGFVLDLNKYGSGKLVFRAI